MAGGGASAPAATGFGAKVISASVGSAIGDAAYQAGRKTSALDGPRVGSNSNLHGFAASSAAPARHTSGASFQRQKGVVNTASGAKDMARDTVAVLAPRGQGGGPRIMDIGTMDSHSAEGKARREGIEKRQAAGGNKLKTDAVHMSGGGGRTLGGGGGGGGGAVIHRLGDDSRKDRPSARYGGLKPALEAGQVFAPTKEIRASRVVATSSEPKYTAPRGGVALGGGSANVSAQGMSDREKRLAFVAKKEAEAEALRAIQAQG